MDQIRLDLELPDQMAGLDIMEFDKIPLGTTNQELHSPPNSRVLRRRKPVTTNDSKKTNRRVLLTPRKRSAEDMTNPKNIEALYLNKKKGKVTSQTLETIHEEPQNQNGASVTLIGGRKVKRLITFPLGSQYTKDKIKKRRAKIKKLLGTKSFLNRKKIPMAVFLKNIEHIEIDEIETDNKVSSEGQ